MLGLVMKIRQNIETGTSEIQDLKIYNLISFCSPDNIGLSHCKFGKNLPNNPGVDFYYIF